MGWWKGGLERGESPPERVFGIFRDTWSWRILSILGVWRVRARPRTSERPGPPWQRVYCIEALGSETYAMLCAGSQHQRQKRAPCLQPAHSTSTSTSTRHPAPAPCLHRVKSQLTAPAPAPATTCTASSQQPAPDTLSPPRAQPGLSTGAGNPAPAPAPCLHQVHSQLTAPAPAAQHPAPAL